jgi:DNA-binding HxlR family transcriptional regulator
VKPPGLDIEWFQVGTWFLMLTWLLLGTKKALVSALGTRREPMTPEPMAREPMTRRPIGLEHTETRCGAKEVLDRVGDKWSLYTIAMLDLGTTRFSDLKRGIEGISQRMLTVTLRGLERDGLITRTQYPTVPVKVEYALTPAGRTLVEAVMPIIAWAEANHGAVDAARAAYDARREAG